MPVSGVNGILEVLSTISTYHFGERRSTIDGGSACLHSVLVVKV